MHRNSGSEAAFPDRVCEACGNKGGGHPNGGVDNVVVYWGRQLCGRHVLEIEKWFTDQKQAAISSWVDEYRRRGARKEKP